VDLLWGQFFPTNLNFKDEYLAKYILLEVDLAKYEVTILLRTYT
jgi:hypothetical protein